MERRRGLTLIEVLVCLAILGVLLALIIPAFLSGSGESEVPPSVVSKPTQVDVTVNKTWLVPYTPYEGHVNFVYMAALRIGDKHEVVEIQDELTFARLREDTPYRVLLTPQGVGEHSILTEIVENPK